MTHWDKFWYAAAVTAGILFATYHMIAWYGRIGGMCS